MSTGEQATADRHAADRDAVLAREKRDEHKRWQLAVAAAAARAEAPAPATPPDGAPAEAPAPASCKTRRSRVLHEAWGRATCAF